jgi:hypothetical protein
MLNLTALVVSNVRLAARWVKDDESFFGHLIGGQARLLVPPRGHFHREVADFDLRASQALTNLAWS